MPRDYKVYLEDILSAIDKVNRFTAGLTQNMFSTDEKTQTPSSGIWKLLARQSTNSRVTCGTGTEAWTGSASRGSGIP